MSQISVPNIYGILGYPLGQSMSPLIHNTSFKDNGINAAYYSFPTPPEKIATFMEAIRLLNIRGCSVTIPHKQTILPYLDKVTDRVKKIGAANLIYWEGDKLCGDNTDIIGFMAPLQANKPNPAYKKILILGAGGAARAAVVGLQDLGYTDITVTDIVEDLPAKLAKDFNLKTISWDKRDTVDAQIIVNASPLGMKGKYEDESPYKAEWFKGKKGIAYDIVYTPYVTLFRKYAEEAGWESISGREMFIGQADAQFKAWTGKNLSKDAVQAVIDALSK
ncbi:shikimate dehydrogenase [Zophobihabitans entericus]|uniref:Shikimate dehydrogenase (NADP(+)) n=1 Tax=Zophobihabitans entericus TaxID=1635327 RepID=A0A6G9IC23_9GAMM|nr:shikimate dehydrogenase [Zophobihabitans entericus]QIQ21130.1 shikimate dehydrogenase [Zophobihabitans entericus]